MLAAERQRKIKKYISETKTANIITLSNLFCVSQATIRRDLDKLASEGYVSKTHGGAILKETSEAAQYNRNDIDEYYLNKEAIGEIASYIIRDNDTVILSTGSVCQHIAKKIKTKSNLIIITPDLKVANELSIPPTNAKILVTGGELNTTNMQLSGELVSNVLDSMYVNCAFVDIDGLKMDRGYFVDSTEKATLIKKILNVSQKTIAVCDISKFDTLSFYHLGNFSMFDTIITNEQIPDIYKEMFFNLDIKLITTFDITKEF